MAEYRSFHGFVKFPPRESTAKTSDGEVDVRNIVVREVGVKEQAIDVRATLWPSHEHVSVDEGDLVTFEGKFTVNKGENADGEPQTYFNVSVSTFFNHGPGDTGVRDEEEARPKKKRSSKAADEDNEAW